MTTAVNEQSKLNVVYGNITASDGTDAALTTNDGSATLARNAAGNFTVTFGDAFLSAPSVVASPVLTVGAATTYGTDAIGVIVDAVATNSFEVNVFTVDDSTDNGDLVDAGTVQFVVVGLRDS